jgi:hypothetical protein
MRRVWPGAVVEENNLNQNITALRKCLGDSRQASRYIATIPGLGYRFVAEVKTAPLAETEPSEELRGQSPLAVEKNFGPDNGGQFVGAERTTESAHAAAAEEAGSSARVEPSPTHADDESADALSQPKSMVAPLVLVLLFVAASAYAFWSYRNTAAPQPAKATAQEVEVTALTRTGTTGRAAISPDGRYIVYSVAEAGRESLWLRQASASSAQQIVLPARVEYTGLTFSRDGNHLYFVRTETNGSMRAL